MSAPAAGSSSSTRAGTGIRTLSTPRLASNAVVYVLGLCLPYVVSATPLPSSPPAPLPPPSRAFILRASLARVSSHLFRRQTLAVPRHTFPTAVIAHPDISGMYHMPADFVPLIQKFNGGFIVLSYVIAFVGSLCTLELLIRRTTNSGWRNQVLLLAAGITFGAVSTFAMHFIFNNSLSLHHPLEAERGYPSLYLQYGAGYTVLSLVVSCVAMTMAFFIMGTHWQDWWCMPGSRRRGSRRGSAYSDKSSEAPMDEYGAWKSSHKVLRRGTMGMGALLASAGQVTKWNLLDGEGGEKRNSVWSTVGGGRKGSTTKGEQGLDGLEGQSEEAIIRSDKRLAELDFRLGRSAVKLELERRQGGGQGNVPTPTSAATTDDGRGSVEQLPGVAIDYPTLPTPTYQLPPSRRGSAAPSEPPEPASQEVFTPGFSFPARRHEQTDSTSSLLAHDAVDPDPAQAPHYRRASMPANAQPFRADLPIPSSTQIRHPHNTLARIQSLPETELSPEALADPKQNPYDQTLALAALAPATSHSSAASSAAEPKPRGAPSPTLSVTAQLGGLQRAASSGAGSRGTSSQEKKVVRLKARRTMTRLEKFLGFDVVTTAEIVKIFCTGTIAGFGVVSMHYIGQLSIIDMPYVAYKVPYVIGSVIIASGAVVIALYIMFIMLRPKLKHTWISKILVALILSVAVCAMHFCGMMGTIYAWPIRSSLEHKAILTGTNRAITAIVATLAFCACIASVVFFVLHSIKLKRERARRRRVVVAAVFLDAHDRVLVDSTDGLLPMCDIASLTGADMRVRGSRRSFRSTAAKSSDSQSTVLGMDLSTGHDAFVSALRLSWSWKSPGLVTPPTFHHGSSDTGGSHLSKAGTGTSLSTLDARRGSLMTMESSLTGPVQQRLSVAKFLERFAASSGQLAGRVIGTQDAVSRLGVLYDQILTTGWVKLSNSNDTVSKGQLIFLVRRITSSAERTDLLSRHYIFADADAVASALHKTLSVPLDHTMPLLEDVRAFCDSTLAVPLRPSTLYAGVAVVQATPFDGLRVLLEQDNRSQLPMREICQFGSVDTGDLSGTIEELGEAMTWLDGMSLLSVITRNMTVDGSTHALGGPRVAQVLAALERAIIPMLDSMLTAEDMAHLLPRLTLHPQLVPLTPGNPTRKVANLMGGTPPYLVVFYANYDAAVNTFTDKWLPFRLFRAQNACVMAPRVSQALRAEAIVLANDSDASAALNGGWNPGRRPSKVQFDFSEPTAPAEDPISVHEASAPPPGGGAMFGGYAFPPKVDEKAGSKGVGTAGGPRRSSLAKSSRFGGGGGGGPGATAVGMDVPLPIHEVSGADRMPGGVAEWDPDWLLNLLRTKLRAEA